MKLLIAICMLATAFNSLAKERIVSVGGNVTEIIYELGKGDSLVGTDTTSTFPAAANSTKKVGYARALSAEGILSLNPSVVFVTEEAGPAVVLKQLEEAKVNIITLPTEFSVEGAIAKVKAVSEYLNEEAKGKQIIADIKAQVAQAKKRIEESKKPKILFILSRRSGNLLVSGKETQADGMINLVGGINPMSSFNSYKPLTPEQIAEVMPDVILMMSRHGKSGKSEIIDSLKSHPVLKLTPAVKNNKIITMDGMYLLGFGPRTGLAMQDLAEQVYD